MNRLYYCFACLPLLLFLGCPPEEDRDYAADMRSLVVTLSHYAKMQQPGFLIIPQNGEALLTLNQEEDGELAAPYLAAIDGLGREDLFYGYEGDNLATPEEEQAWMLALLRRAQAAGRTILVTDYCSTPAYVDRAYAENTAEGFLCFAADRRELDGLPAYPATPHQSHPGAVNSLADARNFLYLINSSAWSTWAGLVSALTATEYDLLILDFFDETGTPPSPQEMAQLQVKHSGGRRLVIAYLSIGEAEDYRYYWQASWNQDPPAFLEAENPHWPGNYAVRYWEAAWQDLLFGGSNAYLDRIIAAGFDGVYLDKIDSYEFFAD